MPDAIQGSVINAIKDGAKRTKTVMISYKDTKGNVSERETEPYEVKEGKYYGFCLMRNQIRAFSLHNITGAHVTDKTFLPKWDIKI